jgi:DNA polymerase III sliding clamp (beta) subunit (PCNA family)
MNPISILMAELKPALAGLGKVISKRSSLPVLGCVKLERSETGQLLLTGTDLDSTAVVTLATCDPGPPTSLLVPFEDLKQIAKSSERLDILTVAMVEKDLVSLRFPVGGQMIEHRCVSFPADEYPTLPDIGGDAIPLNAAVRESIHEALSCASQDSTRLILNGACLDVSRPKGHYVVGTDGRHLFSSNSFALPMKKSLVIPSHRFLGCKEFNTDGDWTLRVGAPVKDEPTTFELATAHWRFVSRSPEGNYPDWRQAVPGPTSAQTTAEFEANALESIIHTIVRLPNHDGVNFSVRMDITDRQVTLLAKSRSEEPWRSVAVHGVRARGKDVSIHLNRNLLIKALSFGLTHLDLIDGRSPLRFSFGGRQMVIMPTRVEP